MSVRALSPRADPQTLVFAIGGRIRPEDVRRLCDYVCARLAASEPRMVVCDLEAAIASDAVALEAFARLQLASRRRGCTVELRNASKNLRELLEFAGLDAVVPLVED